MQTDSHNIRKRFSQNFLKDQNVIEKIVSIINPQKNDYIVEIGPGKGALTIPIFKSVSKLNVIEIDKDLVKLLRKNIKDESFIIHEDDAMKFNYLKFKNSELRLVGNLPYNISTPLLFHLLSYKDVIKNMYFMLQKEVVERICAKSGTKKYGRLSVMLQCYCDVESMLIIKPDAFYPSPKVDSAIVRLTKKKTPIISDSEFLKFNAIVKAAFSKRRKMLRNSLSGFNFSEKIKKEIDFTRRPETLSIDEFAKLL